MMLTQLVLAALHAGNQTSTEVGEFCHSHGRPATAKVIRRVLWELVHTGRAVNAGKVRGPTGPQTVYRPLGSPVSPERIVPKQHADIKLLLDRLAAQPVMRAADLLDGLDWHKDRKSQTLEKMWATGLIECWEGTPSLHGTVTLAARSPATYVLKTIRPHGVAA